VTRDQLFELAGKSGGRTSAKINSSVPILLMSAEALETFVAAVAVAIGEPLRLSASRVSSNDLLVWPDGSWCYGFELPEMGHMSDDCMRLAENSPAWSEALESIEAGRVL
jgi:hypothetical protein